MYRRADPVHSGSLRSEPTDPHRSLCLRRAAVRVRQRRPRRFSARGWSLVAALWFTAPWLAPRPARAQTRELAYDLRIDLPLTLATAAWIVGSEAAKPQLAAAHCRWCDRTADGRDSLNALDANVRKALRWQDTGLANALSHFVGYGLTPFVTLGTLALAERHDDAQRWLPIDVLIVLETAGLALTMSQIVKFAVGRQRPFVHAREAAGLAGPRSSDDNTSFYSGHTSLAFAVAVAGGVVATMRGYRAAHWVWISGLVLGMTTAYLRVASDRHYFTDVLVGSVIGSGLGVATPLLLHRPRPRALPAATISSVPGGALLTLLWAAP